MSDSRLGTLYIVATPIGNPRDITLRALDVLRSVSAVIGEELRITSTLMKKIGIDPKEIIELNEHTEKQMIPEIIHRLARGQSLALVSDCGTPVFSDPGQLLLSEAAAFDIPISPIPGPSSLMAALSVTAEPMDRFIFGGFLSRQPEKRREELTRLRSPMLPVVLMDTPYRLSAVLSDVEKVFGKGQRLTLACDLTLKTELIFRGTVGDAVKKFLNAKHEFILIIHNHR